MTSTSLPGSCRPVACDPKTQNFAPGNSRPTACCMWPSASAIPRSCGSAGVARAAKRRISSCRPPPSGPFPPVSRRPDRCLSGACSSSITRSTVCVIVSGFRTAASSLLRRDATASSDRARALAPGAPSACPLVAAIVFTFFRAFVGRTRFPTPPAAGARRSRAAGAPSASPRVGEPPFGFFFFFFFPMLLLLHHHRRRDETTPSRKRANANAACV